MAGNSYNLRTRINSPSISIKSTNSTPISRLNSRSPRKISTTPSILQLKHVIGTTAASPNGLCCCEPTNSFAYCAGSVAVLGTFDVSGTVSYRYYKARPTATALNAANSYFDSPSSYTTPTKRRSIFNPKRGHEEGVNAAFGRDWLDDANGQTWSARERIKAATSIAISPDGRFLAVGETGYNPRVLLFSTIAGASTEQPVSIITDHTIGVRSVAFSPDSRYLATLGDVNDGFLHVWSVKSKTGELKLYCTNKCTTNVCDMTWVGTNIITVGTRHIKIWQIATNEQDSAPRKSRFRIENEHSSSPGPTPLHGRNCLLGRMVDATFTAVTAISASIAVVCADDGYICKLDLSQNQAELSVIDSTDYPVAAICFRRHSKEIIWAAAGGNLQVHNIECWSDPELVEMTTNTRRKRLSRHSLLRESLGLSQPKKAEVVALKCLTDRMISVEADGGVKILQSDGTALEAESQRLSSHQDLVKGVQILPSTAGMGAFFTWARNGEIRFWSIEGALLRTESCDLDELSVQDEPGTNELRLVRYLPERRQLVIGDRYGVLKIFSQNPWSILQTARAHSAELTDIAVHEAQSLLASCSRDRMVQLFRMTSDGLELAQTLDEHISAVHHVCFSSDVQKLVSCSADRTVVVRERMERVVGGNIMTAYLSTKVVTLKASPLSMALTSDDQNNLVVSTMDRHVVKVDIATGTIGGTFKVGEKDTEDTTILNSICLSMKHSEDDQTILAGYSSIDKSIRVYDRQKGNLLGREFGHTEGISEIVLIEDGGNNDSVVQRTVVSTGLDSTIMIWSLNTALQPLLTPSAELSLAQAEFYDPPAKPSPVSLPPLRKFLTKMDIAEFVRQSSPSRDPSPHRLKRRTSRLALSTSIEESEENTSPSSAARPQSREKIVAPDKRSPSPPPRIMRPKKQRSKTEITRDVESRRGDWFQRSPSPPPTPLSTPSTPKYQRANNGRLRRPPSVPADLRAQAVAQQRRQSMSTSNDFGSMGMASEQACRMLKAYKKKLQSSRDDLDLDEVEQELEMVLKIVRQKRTRLPAVENPPRDADNDVKNLTALLEKTAM